MTPQTAYRAVAQRDTAVAGSGSPRRRRVRSAILELALVAGLFALYRSGRQVLDGHEPLARRHAELVHHLEDLLHLPSEAAIQGAVESEALLRAANVYYTGVHFPLMIAFLVWGFWRRSAAEYRWARNLAVLQTGAAMVIHAVFPLAPPRMFPEWGFVDTMTVYGPSPYDGASADLANQFAAMPSLHVGWAVLIAYVVTRTAARPLAVVAWSHAALTTAIVIVTANHWWLDAAVAVLLLALADRVLARRAGSLSPRPGWQART